MTFVNEQDGGTDRTAGLSAAVIALVVQSREQAFDGRRIFERLCRGCNEGNAAFKCNVNARQARLAPDRLRR